MTRIAVLGAGRIGKVHAGNVHANPRATLAAIADPYGDDVRDLAAAFGCEMLRDCNAAIDRADVDAVIVGTPTDTHIDLTLRAVRLGKPVLCEKPLDLDSSRAANAVEEIERLGGGVMLAFNRRFDPTVQELKRAIDDGEIGEVRQVAITSRDPGLPPREYIKRSGGIFRDMTIHDFDMARFLLGEEPAEVMAFASRLVDSQLADVDDYDTVMVQMRTASGKQCHINGCREAVYGYDQRLEIFGSLGMLLSENLRARTTRRWTRTLTDAAEPLLDFFLERYQEAYKTELDRFIDSIVDKRPMPATPRDGLMALRLADAALFSATSGAVVVTSSY